VAAGAAAVAANAYDDPTRVAGPPTVAPPEGPIAEDEYEEEEPEKSRVGLAILIGALIVVALGLGGWALFRMLNPAPTVETVAVPSVVDLTEAQATEQLIGAGLKIEVKNVNGDEETKGRVTAQDPAAQTEVNVGSTVTISLNQGPKTATIPKGLVGQDRKDVEAMLDDLKFSNVTSKAANSEDANTKPGEVISISPNEGETVPLDTKITIRYATGKSNVPDFDGLSRAAAIREANDAGFGNPAFVEKETSKGTPGTVISQDPQAGANVDRDTTIRLTLAVQPPPPTTPPPTTEPPTKSPTTPPATPSVTPSKTQKTPSDSNT
jgi:eukaryotic-like serine/threonine-protein kinase